MESIKDDICRFSLLYVDDEPSTHELIASLLKMSYPNLDVIFARSGIDAMKIYQDERPDIVVIDLALPALKGLVLCEMILSRFKESPVIVLTGHGDKFLIDKSAQLGVREYLEKPIHVDSLIAKIQEMLESIFWKRMREASSRFAA